MHAKSTSAFPSIVQLSIFLSYWLGTCTCQQPKKAIFFLFYFQNSYYIFDYNTAEGHCPLKQIQKIG